MPNSLRAISVAARRTLANLLVVFIAVAMMTVGERNARADDDASLVGTIHIRGPSEEPLDWTKKSLFMLGGLGAFALVYAPGVGAATSRSDGSPPDPANKPFLIPFVGPAIYWGHWIGHIHDGVDNDVPPALTDLGAGIMTFALAVDTFIQIGGVTAAIYGAVAPIHESHRAPRAELGGIRVSPVVSFGRIGVVGTF